MPALLLALVASAVGQVALAAPTARSYPAPGVERVYFSSPGTLRIHQGDAATVTVLAPDTVADRIVVDVAADSLFIELAVPGDGSADTAPVDAELLIDVTLPSLKEVVSEGRNRVIADSLKVDALALESLGAARFEVRGLDASELQVVGQSNSAFVLSGRVDRQVLELADAGAYQAGDLASNSVEARIRGDGYVVVTVRELLDVIVAGTASVRYLGSPFVSQSVSGSGSVKPVSGISI